MYYIHTTALPHVHKYRVMYSVVFLKSDDRCTHITYKILYYIYVRGDFLYRVYVHRIEYSAPTLVPYPLDKKIVFDFYFVN